MSSFENTLTGTPGLIKSRIDSPPDDPIVLLRHWLEEAIKVQQVEPYAFTLSTVTSDGTPSSRVILMKEITDTGIIFCSSGSSKKGLDIAATLKVAGAFWWPKPMVQIRFQGEACTLDDDVSDKHFKSRSLESRAATAIADQSQVLEDVDAFKDKVKSLLNSEQEIMRPQTWHAYHIDINTIEFWQGQTDRLHQRLYYERHGNTWQHCRLQP